MRAGATARGEGGPLNLLHTRTPTPPLLSHHYHHHPTPLKNFHSLFSFFSLTAGMEILPFRRVPVNCHARNSHVEPTPPRDPPPPRERGDEPERDEASGLEWEGCMDKTRRENRRWEYRGRRISDRRGRWSGTYIVTLLEGLGGRGKTGRNMCSFPCAGGKVA